MEIGPCCGLGDIKKNGYITSEKQNYYCRNSARNFVENPEQRIVTERDKALETRLVSEGLSIQAISRVIGVSLQWVLDLARTLS